MDLLERRRRSRTAPAPVVPLPSTIAAGPTPSAGSASWSSPSRSCPRSTASPTRSAGCSSTSRPRATTPSWSRRPAPTTYAGFPVTHARGASLPFYADFRIGLETRRRLRATMVRFPPDVVHIASPATLGHQAARAARSLGIPTVAIYQTDLVGFAERYAVPGGARAMESLTRRIHLGVDRTLAPSTASIDQLARLGIGDVARWPGAWTRSCSTPAGATRRCTAGSPRRRGPRRVRRPARAGEGARAARPRRPAPGRPAGAGRRRARGGPAAGAAARTPPSSACCTATSSPGPTPPSTSSCTPAATRPTASPRRRRSPAACRSWRRGPAGRSTSSTTPSRATSTSPATPTSWSATSSGSSPTRCSGGGWRSRPGSSVRGRTWQAVNELLVEHYRDVSAPVVRRRRAG